MSIVLVIRSSISDPPSLASLSFDSTSSPWALLRALSSAPWHSHAVNAGGRPSSDESDDSCTSWELWTNLRARRGKILHESVGGILIGVAEVIAIGLAADQPQALVFAC